MELSNTGFFGDERTQVSGEYEPNSYHGASLFAALL